MRGASARGLDASAFDKAKPCAAGTNASRPAVCEYGSAIGNAGSLVRSLVRSPDGTIWIGAVNGVTTFDGTLSVRATAGGTSVVLRVPGR